jgi:hypothetical protein
MPPKRQAKNLGAPKTAGEIDIGTILAEGSYLTETTQRKYNCEFQKYATFHGFHWNFPLLFSEEQINDHKIAHFIAGLGVNQGYLEHVKKSAMAAINHMLGRLNKENVYQFPHVYPETTAILKQWYIEIKANPYYPKSASGYSPEAVFHILGLTCDSSTELLDKVSKVCFYFRQFLKDKKVNIYN